MIERLKCSCGTVVEGRFSWSRLANLSVEDQQLVELIVLASGSLKDAATRLGISYPTMRKRINALIKNLTAEIEADQIARKQVLKDVVEGKRPVSEATYELGD